jgi:hypothetical protein
MELKDFVKAALTDIVQAIREARTETEEAGNDALIAPRMRSNSDKVLLVAEEDGYGVAFPVEFDLSLTVSEANSANHGMKGKLSIANVVSVGGSTGDTTADTKTVVQKLRFTVPVRYPNGAPEKRQQAQRPSRSVGWQG